MSEELRKRFLAVMGEMYESYGYPSYCGWIEGLLLLEREEWSQRKISGRLREFFPESKYPTSITSVNRALKVLEDYGVLEKAGSRKAGYRYRTLSSSGVIATMLERFVAVNQQFIDKLQALSSEGAKNDPELRRAISYQTIGAKLWNRLIGELIASINKDA